MASPLHRLITEHARWKAEHDQVRDAAAVINVQRMRWVAAAMAAMNALHVLGLLVRRNAPDVSAATNEWAGALLMAHAGMGVGMALCSWAGFHLHAKTGATWARRWLPLVTAAIGLGSATAIVVIDQLVTPNITPFVLAALGFAAMMYLRPGPSALLYLANYLVYFFALPLTQHSEVLLLSNRMAGLGNSAVGWSLSVLLWRNFTTITLQQKQLADANAALQKRQDELKHLSRHDGLTGLYNRKTFVEMTEAELARARRQTQPTALLLLDLDHFKQVNDTWGHPAGDAVLRTVAELLLANVRNTDVVGRLGGEEFVVLLPGTTQEGGRVLAEKLLARLTEQPVLWHGAEIPVSASFGVSADPGTGHGSFNTVYSRADAAMYKAKGAGRGRIALSSQG